MSNPRIAITRTFQVKRLVLITAVLTVTAAALGLLLVASDGDDGIRQLTEVSAPAVRPGGGPDETAVAAAITPAAAAARPDESGIAAEIRTGAREQEPRSSHPDEARVAAAIAP